MSRMELLVLFALTGGIAGMALLVRGRRVLSQGKGAPRSTYKKRRVATLQRFLPLQGFHPSGAMIVSGRFRQMIRVGDQNLYAMTLEDITVMRDRFRDMVKHLDHPFQLSVQARRANYTDFVRYSEEAVRQTAQDYANDAFSAYARALGDYLSDEAARPRTDRENLIVIGVVPKITGEDAQGQLQRLARERGFVEGGLQQMGLSYEVLDPIACVETIQNLYNRERAMSQRYRDVYYRQTHAPHVDGQEVTPGDRTVAQKGEEAAHRTR